MKRQPAELGHQDNTLYVRAPLTLSSSRRYSASMREDDWRWCTERRRGSPAVPSGSEGLQWQSVGGGDRLLSEPSRHNLQHAHTAALHGCKVSVHTGRSQPRACWPQQSSMADRQPDIEPAQHGCAWPCRVAAPYVQRGAQHALDVGCEAGVTERRQTWRQAEVSANIADVAPEHAYNLFQTERRHLTTRLAIRQVPAQTSRT